MLRNLSSSYDLISFPCSHPLIKRWFLIFLKPSTNEMPEQLAVFKSLQHPTRMEILKFLGDHPQDVLYTDLLPFCDDSTGKLNYHLRTLDDLLTKTDNGYNLSEKGVRVLNWLKSYQNPDEIVDEFQRPDIIFNKLYPAKSLHYKYLVQLGLIFLPFVVASILLSVFASSLIPIVLISGVIAIALICVKLFYDSIWYRITETEIEVFKGFITHTHKIVPFRTVTNVDLKRGPFDRIFGIATVDVQTAGSSNNVRQAEEHIVGMIEGDEIKDTILERIRLLNPIDVINASRKTKPQIKIGLHALKNELNALNRELANR